jgi:chloramphenicol 3-O phosphotransferase
VGTDVIVLNGGSSAGKSSIARCLQTVLPRPWLTLGIDDLLEAMPPPESGHDPGLTFDPAGAITVSSAFRPFEAAWFAGLAAMARAGVGVIVDEVFLGAAASQARLRSALGDLAVLWVGVRCALQAANVHEGVRYDIEVDTTAVSAMDCARTIAAHVIA